MFGAIGYAVGNGVVIMNHSRPDSSDVIRSVCHVAGRPRPRSRPGRSFREPEPPACRGRSCLWTAACSCRRAGSGCPGEMSTLMIDISWAVWSMFMLSALASGCALEGSPALRPSGTRRRAMPTFRKDRGHGSSCCLVLPSCAAPPLPSAGCRRRLSVGGGNRMAQRDGETASPSGSANRHSTNPARFRGELGQNANCG